MRAPGAAREREASRFLQARGLQLLDRNFHCRLGEIDLIMRDGEELVFVEVRHRGPGALVDAASSVDAHKQRRLIQAARVWLSRHPRQAEAPMRFDVCAGDGEQWRWIRNAFDGL